MKKKIFFLLSAITLSYNLFAQLTNSDFVINNGNDATPISCGSNPGNSFLPGSSSTGPGSLQDWYRSHGTPIIVNNCQNQPEAVRLIGQGKSLGQGIAHQFHFRAGKKYTICYRILNWDASGASLWFACGNALTQSVYPSCYCVCPLPFTSLSSLMMIPGNLPANASGGCAELYDQQISFTADKDYDFFYISFSSKSETDHEYHIDLEYVNVIRECESISDIYFSDGTTGAIPGGYYDAYNNIFAGSSYGVSSTPVATSASLNTTFEATRSVKLDHNFMAQVNSGHFFLAQINPYSCSNYCAPTGGKSGITTMKEASQPLYSVISIHPNPCTGSFTIDLPTEGNYDIHVANMMGATVYTAKTSSQRVLNVQLGDNMPPGNYSVHITGKDIHHVEKITIAK